MENDLISRAQLMAKLDKHVKTLRKQCGDYDHYTDGFDDCVDMVATAPAVEAEPVRNGWWVEWWPGSCALIMTGEEMLWMCSECEAKYSDKENMNYCPNCGAKMNAKEDDHG